MKSTLAESISYTINLFRIAEKVVINSPQSIPLDVLREMFGDCMHSHEEVWGLFLDNSLNLLFFQKVGMGSNKACVMDQPSLYTTALTQRASHIILAHNHPSGNRSFSKADLNLARNIYTGCQKLSLTLADFIVVTPQWDIISAKEKGIL